MYMLVVVGRPLLTEITEYYQHHNPLLKWLPPRIEGVCYTQKENFMYFQVIATHNPQDFFSGQEPNELTLTFIVKEDALMETVKQCVIGGYIAIVYPFENKNN